MSQPELRFGNASLASVFGALRADLVHDEGPQISTMRNYRFAVVVYPPSEEFALRQQTGTLIRDLAIRGWVVLSLSLQRLLLDRLRASGGGLETLQRLERQIGQKSPDRGLNYLREKIVALVEGPDGIAADAARHIRAFAEAHPDRADRALVLLGRAGALYPFLRSSALLKHLDGRTANIPVLLLYPGERRGEDGLSFMGELPPDRDYRPRIYGGS